MAENRRAAPDYCRRMRPVGQKNDLAEKHNGIIGEMNSRTTNYDALVERLKELAKTSKTSSTR